MTIGTRALVVALAAAVGAAGCAPRDAVPQPEPPTLDLTHWTDDTELFMEYPPLVAGETALFAVHLTTLVDFQPVTTGRASVELTPEGGGPLALTGPAPARPGVFRVEGVLPAPGQYRFALVLLAPALPDRHDLGVVTVFADEAAAFADAAMQASDDAAAIVYLKEPQWTNDFATTIVRDDDIRMSVRAPAMVHPLPGGEAVVTTPAAGRFMADALLSIGTRVQAGQVLGRLEPRLSAGVDRVTLGADVAEARAALDAARLEYQRATRLLAERAVPARRVEDGARAVAVAEARLHAAEARLSQRDETLSRGGGAAAGNAFVLRAPINGRLAEASATLGASYDEGVPLFKIVRTERVELEVQVPVADVALARQATGLALEVPGQPVPLVLEPHHVHDAGVIHATTRALPLRMEIDNPGERLLIGQVGTAVLFTQERRRVPIVPSAAVLSEGGRPYVFVQTAGERFARRFIEVAARDGDRVGVASGVSPGARVVTRGAYEVHLASAATGLPAEGHVH